MKLINNTDDSQSLRRVINVPKRGLGDTTVKNLSDFAGEKDISLYEAIKICEDSTIAPKTCSKLKDFANLIYKFQQAKDSYSLKDFVTLVIEKSGYLAELQVLYNSVQDPIKRKLISQDIDKANSFIDNNVTDTEYYILFKEKNVELINQKIRTLIQGLAVAGLESSPTSNNDLRVILDSFFNGGSRTDFGMVIA